MHVCGMGPYACVWHGPICMCVAWAHMHVCGTIYMNLCAGEQFLFIVAFYFAALDAVKQVPTRCGVCMKISLMHKNNMALSQMINMSIAPGDACTEHAHNVKLLFLMYACTCLCQEHVPPCIVYMCLCTYVKSMGLHKPAVVGSRKS
jgi:hypothetical protein